MTTRTILSSGFGWSPAVVVERLKAVRYRFGKQQPLNFHRSLTTRPHRQMQCAECTVRNGNYGFGRLIRTSPHEKNKHRETATAFC